MDKMRFSILINAPIEKVWNTVISDADYRQWTEPFHPGSYFVGDWSQGSKILFLGPGENGVVGGMVSRIKESKPFNFLSIEHLGIYHNGVEDTTSDDVKLWAGACENYILEEKENGILFTAEMDSNEVMQEMFENTWPVALQKLKALAENNS